MSGEHHESPFGKPLDPALLVDPVQPRATPLPIRPLLALALPAASLSGAVLFQKILEGPVAQGDALGRWLQLASLVGIFLGALSGGLLSRGNRVALRITLWTLWGALSPALIVGLVAGSVRAVHPLREKLAERAAEECRATRKVCSANEFVALCASANSGARAKERVEDQLGAAAQALSTSAGEHTYRWFYAGPWTPENWVAPGSIICSVVVDAQGNALRSAHGPGLEVP